MVSGSLSNGMIVVNSDSKVKLKLNGVTIANSSGPAIVVENAKNVTLTLIEGTTNTLSDGSNDAYSGVITSNDTIKIKGSGTLVIQANNAHGIDCDDDISIKNGTIQITAKKTGLMANDDITISGGTLQVSGGTNGIKSKGTLNISGGTICVSGSAKESKSSLYSSGIFTITGGTVIALGCGASTPSTSTSTQCSAILTISPSGAVGSTASVSIDGSVIASMASTYGYNTVFVSSPSLKSGKTVSLSISERSYGSVELSSTVTTGTLVAS